MMYVLKPGHIINNYFRNEVQNVVWAIFANTPHFENLKN
jgi:hypothetical protein